MAKLTIDIPEKVIARLNLASKFTGETTDRIAALSLDCFLECDERETFVNPKTGDAKAFHEVTGGSMDCDPASVQKRLKAIEKIKSKGYMILADYAQSLGFYPLLQDS